MRLAQQGVAADRLQQRLSATVGRKESEWR